MGKVVVCDHPLILHKLAFIRDETTKTKQFRELVDEVAALMAYELTRELPLQKTSVKTPITTTECWMLSGKVPVLIPILRAGLGMVEGILQLMPTAKIGHIGLSRDEKTLEPVEYYIKLPADAAQRPIIVIDPMLATGGSANAAIRLLKEKNCSSIKLMCLIAAPEGIQAVQAEHPEVDIYTASIDQYLNESGYIVPGLGDAGDRLFGTL
ncbi:MAG: uracil phosphoribosyltransferase [Bacilli bacterium]|nr:uracil phosphoribosyltransferase [Bacilli bacterium]